MSDTIVFFSMGPNGQVPIEAAETSPGSGVFRLGTKGAKERYSPYMISAAGTYNISGSSTFVNRIRVLAGGAGVVTIYRGGVLDPVHYTGTPATGDLLAEEMLFTGGLTIVTAGAAVLAISHGAG